MELVNRILHWIILMHELGGTCGSAGHVKTNGVPFPLLLLHSNFEKPEGLEYTIVL